MRCLTSQAGRNENSYGAGEFKRRRKSEEEFLSRQFWRFCTAAVSAPCRRQTHKVSWLEYIEEENKFSIGSNGVRIILFNVCMKIVDSLTRRWVHSNAIVKNRILWESKWMAWCRESRCERHFFSSICCCLMTLKGGDDATTLTVTLCVCPSVQKAFFLAELSNFRHSKDRHIQWSGCRTGFC